MRAIFPQKWDAQFSNEQVALLNMDEWEIGIRDLTDEQLAKGVDNVRRNCEWPPSIAEFREACLGKEELNEFGLNYVPEYYRQPERDKSKLLSSTDRDKAREKGKEAMKELKKKLGISSNQG